MKAVTLRLDPVTRITLIVIAAALVIIALNQLFPATLEANPQVMDVNIAKVHGVWRGELPVVVERSETLDVNIARVFGEEYPYRTYGRLPIDVD